MIISATFLTSSFHEQHLLVYFYKKKKEEFIIQGVQMQGSDAGFHSSGSNICIFVNSVLEHNAHCAKH